MTNPAAVEKEKKDEKLDKRKALGRGLASLLPGPRVVAPAEQPGAQVPQARTDAPPSNPPEVIARPSSQNYITNLATDLIDKNPYQTRIAFDEAALRELADSIKENGVVQPVVVRPAAESNRYTLVLGERRLRASKLAGKENIPAIVRRLSPQQAAEMTVLENVQREDLNPLEQAEAFRVLSREFHLTQAQIAERIGVSRESVANHMRLLRLPQEVTTYLLDGRLSFSDCRQLLALEKEQDILNVAKEAVEKHLKWNEIEERVARINGLLSTEPGAQPTKTHSARQMDPNVRAAQMDMERTLGMRVRITDRNGKGKIVIEYATVDDYERVVEMLKTKN
jgi:ParB family transcriptional regulator, chromosome partitioning protein